MPDNTTKDTDMSARLQIRLAPELHWQLKLECVREGLSMQEVVIQQIEAWLRDQARRRGR